MKQFIIARGYLNALFVRLHSQLNFESKGTTLQFMRKKAPSNVHYVNSEIVNPDLVVGSGEQDSNNR